MPPRTRAQRASARAAQSAGRELRDLIPVSETPGAGPVVKAGPVSAPVIPLLLMGIGGYLMWFGVHYWRSEKVAWPSDPVKSLLQGKGLPAQSAATPQSAYLAAYVAGAGAPPQASVTPSSAASAGGAGQVLSQAQIEQLWTQNGGPQDTAAFAAQVAMAESSGRTDAQSANPDGGVNVGIWQLDTRGVGSGYSVSQLSDPVTNARITILATGGGTNWSQWSDPVVSALSGGQYIPQLS